MYWSLTMQLSPEEIVLDDSTKTPLPGLKPAYSVFVTDKRAIFRFDGLGSSMAQSFFYEEITDISLYKRVFITYLKLKTGRKDYLLHVPNPEYWAKKILHIRDERKKASPGLPGHDRRRKELVDMLTVLHRHTLLTETEYAEKLKQIEEMKF